jgi:hypothetical protein
MEDVKHGRVVFWNDEKHWGKIEEDGTHRRYLSLSDGIVPDAYGLRYLVEDEIVKFHEAMHTREGHAIAVDVIIAERCECVVPEDYREVCVVREWFADKGFGFAARTQWGTVDSFFIHANDFVNRADADMVEIGSQIRCTVGGRRHKKGSNQMGINAAKIELLSDIEQAI